MTSFASAWLPFRIEAPMLRYRNLAFVVSVGTSTLACSPLAVQRTRGHIVATLVPAQGVFPSGPELVTFGLPFPRGSLTPAGLSTVRVLRGGVEIPAHVEMLTPYRAIEDSATGGVWGLGRRTPKAIRSPKCSTWVRVARIQLIYSFAKPSSQGEPITVEWGLSSRMADVPKLVDPRGGWHAVTQGSFLAQDLVSEPNVYAVLGKDLLSQGALRTPLDPIDDRVGVEMAPPALSVSGKELPWPVAYDFAQTNFFYGLLNEPSGTNPYRTNQNNNGEAWLFDRSSAMFVLYLRSGSPRVLSEAVRAAVFYERLLVIARQKDGDPTNDPRYEGAFFSWRKPQQDPRDAAMEPLWDPKYSYAESLAYTHWLTGDDRILDKLDAVVGAFSDVPSRWSPNLAPIRKSTGQFLREAWTERNVAFKLLAATIAFELTGRDKYRVMVEQIVEDLLWLQNLHHLHKGGGLYHLGTQHDRDEAGNELIASPWMSVLVVDAMVRVYYNIWPDPRIARFVTRMGNMLAAASKVHQTADGTLVRYPDYLVRPDGSTHTDNDGVPHAADVLNALTWAHHFKMKVLKEPDHVFPQVMVGSPGLSEAFVEELFQTPRENWVLRPYRRYAWMFRPSAPLTDVTPSLWK